jgi:N-acetylmuramoyl-L-alanine amidase
MRPIEWIVVHTSATADKQGRPVDASAEQIRRYHQEHNGWKDIGYHYVVRMGGSIEKGRPVELEGAHVGGFNAKSIGICCSGHGDIADFTAQQHESLASLCARLCIELKLPHTVVIGHREADDFGAPHVDKTCPGTKVVMETVRGLVAASIASHQAPPWASDIARLERRIAALETRSS